MKNIIQDYVIKKDKIIYTIKHNKEAVKNIAYILLFPEI